MTKKKKSFEERYKNIIPEKSMVKIKKMAQKGKGWGLGLAKKLFRQVGEKG
jgi:hypothetical protein